MKKVVITGVSGFIGFALLKRLLNDGNEVWALTGNSQSISLKSSKLHIIQLENYDYKKAFDLIFEKEIDVFFHFAWSGVENNRDNCELQMKNVISAIEAINLAIKLKAKRFVFADSSYEYLVSKNSNNEIASCSIYGTAKLCAQKMCKTIAHNSGIEYIGVLFVNIFGIGDNSNRSTNTLLKKIINNEDLDLITGDNLYDWTYIDDCIDGIIKAATKGINNRVYYVGNKPRKFKDIMYDVKNALKTNVNFNFGTYKENSYVDFSQININQLEIDTGFKISSDFKENIKKTYEWLKSKK